MLADANAVLEGNIARVRNLLSLYGPTRRGRRTVKDADVLRAAVVMLHAGLEDYLRSLLIWKIDTFSPETLDDYGFPNGTKRPPLKITLGELSKFRGATVDEVIVNSVKTHFNEFQTFNDLGDVKKALKQCGIPAAEVEARSYDPLHKMIARRHDIVHTADRNEARGARGQQNAKSISKPTVEAYVASVEALKRFVTEKLRP